ncbi:hypothetical protein C6Q28_00995 [Burkholderia multivorans]|nr:hypothetical protein C6Q28_00995 [Burkholderia multivorans]
MHLTVSCRPPHAPAHAATPCFAPAGVRVPRVPAPNTIQRRPSRPRKPAAEMKKPRQRGVCDVLRF